MKGSSNNSSAYWLMFFSLISYHSTLTAVNQTQHLPDNSGDAGGCPADYFHHVAAQPEKPSYEIGENVTFRCPNAEMLRHSMPRHSQSHQKFKYILYPNDVRVCKSDGTWSSQRPTCTLVHTAIVPARDLVSMVPADIKHCGNGECDAIEGDPNWIDVGSVEESCSLKDAESANKETVLMHYTFDRHFYTSLVHFPNSTVGKFPGVKVKDKRKNIISEMSKDSEKLLAAHREAFRKLNPSKSCVVTHLATFTREIIVEFSYEKNTKHKNIPAAQFFVIPEHCNSQNSTRKRNQNYSIPPLIRHSHLKLGSKMIQQSSHSPTANYSHLLKRRSSDEELRLSVNNGSSTEKPVEDDDGSIDIDSLLQYALLVAALFVGIIIGIAVISVFFFRRHIREKSRIRAEEIAQRHAEYNDRTQVDQQGYLLPMLIDLSDDNSESGYLSPICLSQATNATSPALPARNQQPSSHLTAINLNDLDPLFNSERAVATQSDCGYVEAVERQSSDNLYEESYVNLFASKEHTYSEVSSPGKST